MLHLLTKTSIFTKLPNECLCQMTGMPLIYATPPTLDWYMPSSDSCMNDLKKRKRDPLEGSGPRKRLKLITWKNLSKSSPKSRRKLEIIPSERWEKGRYICLVSLTSSSDEHRPMFYSFVHACFTRDRIVSIHREISLWACLVPMSLTG
ncbi:hypothetical protein BDR07DRAFT_471973 [Suillus spraguei]|nr:hypothetical protein BDR07DRAFT_471973 [Suillus spraguei]